MINNNSSLKNQINKFLKTDLNHYYKLWVYLEKVKVAD